MHPPAYTYSPAQHPDYATKVQLYKGYRPTCADVHSDVCIGICFP